MHHLKRAAAVLVVVVGAAACGSSDPVVDDTPDAAVADAALVPDGPSFDAGGVVLPETAPGPLPTGDPQLSVITFNTALISPSIIKGPVERRPVIIEHLEQAAVDVVCLQEVYAEVGHVPDLAAQLADVYPYSYWSWTGRTPFDNGLLIVSKHPLYRGRTLLYEAQGSDVVDRALIAADVLMPDAYFTVMCTHLSAGLAEGDRAVRFEEIEEAFAFAETQGYMDGPLLWLGDFNTGPATDGEDCPEPPCVAAEAASLALLTTEFTDPNTSMGATVPVSVAVPMRAIPSLAKREPSIRIDHCLHRGLAPTTQVTGSRLVHDGPGIVIADGAFAGETMVSLSDHLGVRCDFAVP